MAFRDIIGQRRPLRILKGFLRSGRLPHAFIFSGEPGIGKLFTATNFLKTLICKNRDEEFNCCDKCRSCVLIDNFTFPDLRFIKPEAGQIKIETIRELNEFLNMSPYDAPFKMVLIEEAEKLNISAANAFLKTLEEPPRDAIIILVTEKLEALPDTIRSRCVRIPFSPLSAEETMEVLKRNGFTDSTLASRGEIISDFRLLYEGRPGVLLDEEFMRYVELFERLRDELKESQGSKYIQNESLTREDLTKAVEIFLVYLRNRLVYLISNQFEPFASSIREIQVIIEKYKKLLALRDLNQFNLNIKLTWNYIKAILC